MLIQELNGQIMPSSESLIVQNDEFLSKLEQKLIILSAKYGLGDVLFMERDSLNNNFLASFYIRAPKSWSNQKIFDVWEPILMKYMISLKKKALKHHLKYVPLLFRIVTEVQSWFMHLYRNIPYS